MVPAMQVVGPAEIRRILEITDALSLHREAVRIPLGPEGGGRERIDGGILEIVAPENDFDSWLSGLDGRLKALDLSRTRKFKE